MDIGIGRHCGTDVDADGGRVDEFDPGDTLRLDIFHMSRQGLVGRHGFQSRNKAFQNQRGLSGTGNAGDDREAAFGDICL